jgi:hypothetical protein
MSWDGAGGDVPWNGAGVGVGVGDGTRVGHGAGVGYGRTARFWVKAQTLAGSSKNIEYK